MHSLAMAESILNIVLSEAEKHQGKRIESIRINLDTHDFTEADSLRFCFEAMAVGTIAEGAKLKVDQLTHVLGEEQPLIEFEMT